MQVDGFVKSLKISFSVIPAKAGIQYFQMVLDACLRRHDGISDFLRACQKLDWIIRLEQIVNADLSGGVLKKDKSITKTRKRKQICFVFSEFRGFVIKTDFIKMRINQSNVKLRFAAKRCPPLVRTHVSSHLEHPVDERLLSIDSGAGDLRQRRFSLHGVDAAIFIAPAQPLANLVGSLVQLVFGFLDAFDGIEHG
jgi:hypothetical protein